MSCEALRTKVLGEIINIMLLPKQKTEPNSFVAFQNTGLGEIKHFVLLPKY